MDAHLATSQHLLHGAISLADALLAPTTLPLFQSVLSQEARKVYANVERWLLECCRDPHFLKVVGERLAA
jgi:glutathione S-transferase